MDQHYSSLVAMVSERAEPDDADLEQSPSRAGLYLGTALILAAMVSGGMVLARERRRSVP